MNLYKTLGISSQASDKEIKAAYLKLVKIHHPDVETGSVAKFHEIQTAKDILLNKVRREFYDKTGETGKKVQKIEMIVSALFAMEIESLDYDCDLIKRIKNKMIKNISTYEKNIVTINVSLNIALQLVGRIKSDKSLFEEVLSGKISEIKISLLKQEQLMKEDKEVIEYLKEYDDSNGALLAQTNYITMSTIGNL